MSEILSNIVIEQTNINFSPNNNNINITPDATQLNIFAGGLAIPGGNAGELQYNNGTLAGIPSVTYISGNLSLGNVSNVKITGGANNYFLKTDGTGNLTWSTSSSVGNSTPGQLLYNDANIVTGVSNTSVASGTLTFTNLANLKIDGGTNGYVLQTDGTGNLTWTNAPTANAGNGIPGGANTQIQFNDAGLFGGAAGFTFNKVDGNVTFPNNAIANVFVGNLYGTANTAIVADSANTAATVTTNAQPNITSVGTLTSVSISGNTTVTGTTSIQQAKEKVTTVGTGATGTINFDVLTQAILFYTADATANFILNIRGNSGTTLNTFMANNESTTIRFINTNGATGYYATAIQIDGANVIPNWVYPSGTPSLGLANGKDVYDFEIIKTAANTYSVLASKTGYQ